MIESKCKTIHQVLLKLQCLFKSGPCWLIWVALLTMSCDCYGFLKLARSSKSYRCRKSLYFVRSSGTLQPCLPSTNKGVIQTTVTAAWMVFCDRMCKPTICLMFGCNQYKKKNTHTRRQMWPVISEMPQWRRGILMFCRSSWKQLTEWRQHTANTQ